MTEKNCAITEMWTENGQRELRIRKGGSADAAILAEILVASFGTAFADIISRKTIERCADKENCRNMFAAILKSANGQFYIAEANGKPCGELYWCDGEEMAEAAEIVAIHSLPENWGSGVGKAMLETALGEMKRAGKTAVYLWAFKENKRGRRFYEKNGFAADGMERVSEFDGAMEVRYVYQFEG